MIVSDPWVDFPHDMARNERTAGVIALGVLATKVGCLASVPTACSVSQPPLIALNGGVSDPQDRQTQTNPVTQSALMDYSDTVFCPSQRKCWAKHTKTQTEIREGVGSAITIKIC